MIRYVNQRGEPIIHEELDDLWDISHEDLPAIVLLLAKHLKVKLVKTNATKHGDTEIQLIDEEGITLS